LLNDLNTKIGTLSKEENAILTIKINNKYIGEFELFSRILLGLESLKDDSIGESNKVCSVCGKRQEKVSGNINTFKFYTIDKPGFIVGGFNEKLSWRNFPVCQDCKLALETGREFIESKLNFKFVYGLNYFLLPKFLLGTSTVSKEIIDYFTDGPKKISMANDTVKRITADEQDILALLSSQNDVMTIQFLFMRGEQSAERILLLIEDVYPSMLRKIFDAKEKTDYTWRCVEREFNFGILRKFFIKSDENKHDPDLDKYFLQIVEGVFRLRTIEKHFVLKFIMKKIRYDFNNEYESFHWTVLDGIVSLTFLIKLSLVSYKEVKNVIKSQFEDVFANIAPMLTEPAAKGIFLLGALTKLLLNKQYVDRGNEPFAKQLKGLRLTERDIRGLLPKVQNKLIEYESFDKGKRQMAEEISLHLLSAGENWPLTLDEINFYFATGMNLANLIAKTIYPEKEEAV
jgi:CRISPR-associated protein Csh1